MGKIIDKIKVWFGNRKSLKVILSYFKNRAKTKQEILLRGLGGMLTIWTAAIFASFISIATGQDPRWGITLAVGLGATGQYLTQLYRVMFGKPKNGNGNGEEASSTEKTT